MTQGDIADTGEYMPLTAAEVKTLHRMAHQVDELHRLLSPLLPVLPAVLPVLEAYGRGGMLAARTAAKRAGRVTGPYKGRAGE